MIEYTNAFRASRAAINPESVSQIRTEKSFGLYREWARRETAEEQGVVDRRQHSRYDDLI